MKKKKKPSTQKPKKQKQVVFNSSLAKALKEIEPIKSPPQHNTHQVNNRQLQSQQNAWEQAIKGVTPLDVRDKTVQHEQQGDIAQNAVGENKLVIHELNALVHGETPFHIENSDEYSSGFQTGLDPNLFFNFKNGALSYSRHLDLHGQTKAEAKDSVQKFLLEARRAGHQCVLIITGRGLGSPQKKPVLKESLPIWLRKGALGKIVLAYATAKPQDGGPGAFYVLLKKHGQKPFHPTMLKTDDH